MLINKHCIIEKACTTDQTRPQLQHPTLDTSDPKLPVVWASDGMILAVVPVQVEEGDTAGAISREALKASRKCPKSSLHGLTIHASEDTLMVDYDITERPENLASGVNYKAIIDGASEERKKSATIKIGINAAALADLAKALGSDHVSLEIADSLASILVRPLGVGHPRPLNIRAAKVPSNHEVELGAFGLISTIRPY